MYNVTSAAKNIIIVNIRIFEVECRHETHSRYCLSGLTTNFNVLTCNHSFKPQCQQDTVTC